MSIARLLLCSALVAPAALSLPDQAVPGVDVAATAASAARAEDARDGIAGARAEDARDKESWELLLNAATLLQVRVDAAKQLAARAKGGPEAADTAARFEELGAKYATDYQLRGVLAECIAKCDSPETQKRLAKSMGKGQSWEKLFRLRAAKGCAPGPVDEAALELLGDKDADVRAAALALLVDHEHQGAIAPLIALVDKGKDEALRGPAVVAISDLTPTGEAWNAWEQRLFELARNAPDDVRRAAMSVLARSNDAARLTLFLDALGHSDWSSRSIALSWLERNPSKEAVNAIIARYPSEPVGSRLHADYGDALRKITAHPLSDDAASWATWWENVRATYELPKQSSGGRTKSAERPHAQSGTGVAAEFYGIVIESLRVVFIIDVSGSMLEPTTGEGGEEAPRMEVARRELLKIVDALPEASLFNIISFSDAVVPWLDGIEEAGEIAGGPQGGKGKKGPSTGKDGKDKEKEPPVLTDKERAKEAERRKAADELLRSKAKTFITALNAAGGTNIHDALELAFEDPAVDTIFFLSDGIPSAGKEVDPTAIRAVVARWNATRNIKINTVAIGEELPLLKWLAQDSGGEYKFFK